jgi:hypothetical protein
MNSLNLCPSATGWPSLTPTHRDPFLSPSKIRKATSTIPDSNFNRNYRHRNQCKRIFRYFVRYARQCVHKQKTTMTLEPGYRSRYSNWLRAGRPRGQVRVPVRERFFTFSRRPDRLWGPPKLLSNWYWRIFPRR